MIIPCKDCLILPICKASDAKHIHISTLLKSLAEKCSTFKSYIELKDLGIDIYSLDLSTPMEWRKHINVPQSKRILKLYEYMNWECYNNGLEKYKIFARGEIPKYELRKP